MILSDRDILARLEDGDLSITPLKDLETQIQPSSVDMRLGETFLEFQPPNIAYIDPTSNQDLSEYVTETIVEPSDSLILHPGDFVLATTQETVDIPDDLIAHVNGRSSLGRLAIVVHSTAGLVDPGYKGEITLEMANLGVAPVALTPGMRIAQLVFTELKSSAKRPYGEERGSKYQEQSGPEASKLTADPEFDS